ncbi:MAG: hypothetical protein V8T00_05935 [Oscillospiraceae bacterium]
MKRLLAVLTAISLALSCAPSAEAGNTKEAAGYIALTFDDGPSGAITEKLLDGLAASETSRRRFSSAATGSKNFRKSRSAWQKRATSWGSTPTGTTTCST